jgi:hypothetical protein
MRLLISLGPPCNVTDEAPSNSPLYTTLDKEFWILILINLF